KATPVTVLDQSRQETTHRYPQFLPDGRHFLYYIVGRPDLSGVYVGSVDGSTKKLVIPVITTAVYASPGYLLFVDGDALLGQRFDEEHLQTEGAPFLVAEHAGRTSGFMSAVSASRTGAIAYAGTISQNGRLVWMSRAGNPLGPAWTPD